MAKRIIVLGLLLLLLTVNTVYAVQDYEVPTQKVIVFHSYHSGLKWTDELQDGIEEALDDDIEVYVEYMDCYRFNDTSYYESLFHVYSDKYKNENIDAIIIADNNAYDFFSIYYEEIFPGVPLVFVGVNNFKQDTLFTPNMTGIAQNSSQTDNIKLIKKLHPNVETIVAVGAMTATSHEEAEAILKAGKKDFPDIQFDSLLADNMEMLLDKLKVYNENTVLIVSGAIKDADGYFIDHATFCEILIDKTKLPVYAMAKTYIDGNGAIGGLAVDPHEHGFLAGNYVAKILKGIKVVNLPIVNKPIAEYTFNYPRLQQFGIDESLLPRNSVILHGPTTQIVVDKKLLYIYLTISAVMAVLLFALILNWLLRRKAEKTLNFLAYYDPLTGVMKRHKLVMELESHLRKNEESPVGIFNVDIRNINTINDTYGHDIGNEVIAQCARIIKSRFDQEGFLFGIEMNGFIVADLKIDDIDEFILKGQDILAECLKPIQAANREIDLEVNVGLSMYPLHGSKIEDVLKNANIATIKSIKNGVNTLCMYQQELYEEILNRIQLEKQLKKALIHQEFELYYQPKVGATECQVLGVEALIRWHHPSGQMVYPLKFIQIAEETGFIVPIGEWVIREACRQIQEWQRMGLFFHVSVNVAAKQLSGMSLLAVVKKALEDYKVSPEYLELEITETDVMVDISHNARLLEELRYLGVKIVLDDFGTGYSSMNYIKELPINKLKIDKSFIDNLEERAQREIIRSMINLGHALNFSINIEGVERVEQFEILRANQANEIQGYLFSRPIPKEEIPDYVMKFKERFENIYLS